MKIYVNTARTFHVMNSYVTGHFEESLALANALATNPPPLSERFRHFDAYMYGCVCGALSSQALNRPEEVAKYKGLGDAHNPVHYDVLSSAIAEDHAKYVAGKTATQPKTDVAQGNP